MISRIYDFFVTYLAHVAFVLIAVALGLLIYAGVTVARVDWGSRPPEDLTAIYQCRAIDLPAYNARQMGCKLLDGGTP